MSPLPPRRTPVHPRVLPAARSPASVKVHRPAIALLRRVVIEIESVLYHAERGVRLGQGVIEAQRLECRRLRAGHAIDCRPVVEPSHRDQGVREAGIRACALRVERDGRPERLFCLPSPAAGGSRADPVRDSAPTRPPRIATAFLRATVGVSTSERGRARRFARAAHHPGKRAFSEIRGPVRNFPNFSARRQRLPPLCGDSIPARINCRSFKRERGFYACRKGRTTTSLTIS